MALPLALLKAANPEAKNALRKRPGCWRLNYIVKKKCPLDAPRNSAKHPWPSLWILSPSTAFPPLRYSLEDLQEEHGS